MCFSPAGPGHIFRITFVVESVEKNRKDRFVELGAKSEESAKEWIHALEDAVRSVREVMLHQRKLKDDATDIAPTQASVPRMLKADEDVVSLFNLDADNAKAEQGWWLARVEEGLRIMQECPFGHTVAASVMAQKANMMNVVIFSATISAILSFSVTYSIINNMLICFVVAAAAISISCLAVTPSSGVEIPSFRVSQVVHGSPTAVFRLLMNCKRYSRWDPASANMKVIQELDDHADVVYITQRPNYLWPVWQKPRDLVLMRYWRREEDGSFFVMYQSIMHPECRVRHNYVRANFLGGGYIIAPQRVQNGGVRSLVTYVLRYDPCGWSRIYHQLGMDVDLVLPMLRSVIGIRDEMSGADFIIPNVTIPAAVADDGKSDTTTIDSSNRISRRPSSVSEDVGYQTFVNANGVVVGVPRLATTLSNKMWAEPDASMFMVRGRNYLNDKKKVASAPAKFHLVGVDLLSFEKPIDRYNVASKQTDVLKTDPTSSNITSSASSTPPPRPTATGKFTFVINMIVPGSDNLCMVFYFHPAKDNVFNDESAFSELLNDFIEGDDLFRNSRFKLLPTVVEGSFIIRQSVGSKPTLLGNKLKCQYHKADNYFEVDVDISSNSVANSVVGMVQGVTKSLVVDMAFLLEAQTEEELPEVLLGAVRLDRVALDRTFRVPRC
uniref:Uncharacterized protein AlNc14C48G3841 n=1 Tax=Albugo laibachii Nc14 TaxID=890382 RepID=F0WAY0_9STRA|nr:conserved hypothetical protein [Albugo laibachii Nc14]CCA18425.1 conserved hypothetical protein [Albugo laibachii Nc14]|eukprot:CCA18425.1 conserved hypothetical protein [Albugo laibachii Nc14]